MARELVLVIECIYGAYGSVFISNINSTIC
jgi:hypothetical protein